MSLANFTEATISGSRRARDDCPEPRDQERLAP
jgi:hypothetical protein